MAKGQVRIKGIQKVQSNLNKELMKIKRKSIIGIGRAADFVLEDTEKTPPLIPVDTGNLRSSKFKSPSKDGAGVRFGFSANYAAKVHFNEGPVNWRRPNSGPFFLSASLSRNRNAIVRIVKEIAKV